MKASDSSTSAIVWKSLHYLKYCKTLQGLLLSLTILSAFLSVAAPWISKMLMDDVLIAGNIDLLPVILGATVLVSVLQVLTRAVIKLTVTRSGNKIYSEIISAIHKKVHAIQLYHFKKTTIGSIMALYTSDARRMYTAYNTIIPSIATETIRFIVLSVVMIEINTLWTIMVLITVPLYAYLASKIASETRRKASAVQERNAEFSSEIVEHLSLVKTTRVNNLSERMISRLRSKLGIVLNSDYSLAKTSNKYAALSMISALLTAAILYMGAIKVVNGDLQVGVLMAYISYTAMLFGPISVFTGMAEQVMTSLAAAERVFYFLEEEPDEDRSGTVVKKIMGDIEFRNVTFSYGGANVLDDFSMKVKAGESVYLCGENGSGKTTILSLLLGLYKPDSGSIYIDDVPLEQYDIKYLRSQIGVIFQENNLYNESIFQNIALWRDDIKDSEIEESAKLVGLHDYVQGTNKGYYTNTGELGSNLSGGERQKIALVRIMLKDPPILLLDEATNALDAMSEKKVGVVLEELMRGKTRIIITHGRKTLSSSGEIHLRKCSSAAQ